MIFHFVNFKILCFSKMLKNVSIIIRYRYFHVFFSPHLFLFLILTILL